MGCALCLSTACSDDKNGLGAPTVTVSQFSPESALPGTELVVTGSNFGEEGRVFFNETEATDYISRSATEIHVRVPANAASGRIGVINGQYGFYRSDDAAQSWIRINDDEHQYGLVLHIIGDMQEHGRCYIGTHGRGIITGAPMRMPRR